MFQFDGIIKKNKTVLALLILLVDEHIFEQGFTNVNVLLAVVLHLLGPIRPVGSFTKLALVITDPVTPCLKTVATIGFHWHPNGTLSVINSKDVRKEHPAKNQRVVEPCFWFKERINALDDWYIKADDVVPDEKLCLSKHV